MPRANVGDVKRWLQDHDTDMVSETPPVQNTWYEVFHAEDVRLLWCDIIQTNDEAAAKDLEVRWTIDGNVYFDDVSLANGTYGYVFRGVTPSTGGTKGLTIGVGIFNAAYYIDKRGLDFKVEVRITSVPGTNQLLQGRCVRETLEIT